MKIKNTFYCITDKYNKPDFRFLFESPKDAREKINQIKNSTAGETIFYSKKKKDFFVDGVKKHFVDPTKKITIKRGCWNALKVRELSILDTIEPEKLFKEIVKSEENKLSYSRHHQEAEAIKTPRIKLPIIRNPFLSFDWESSFLRTKSFAGTFAILCISTILSVFFIQHSATKVVSQTLIEAQNNATEKAISLQTKVLGAKKEEIADQFDDEMNKFVMDTLQSFENLKQEEFEDRLKTMLTGSPMEQMVPYIVQKDRTVAAFLVGIAKKESNWGKRVPILNGQDCYNYWGYRGIRDRMGTGGHTCFDSPEDAVNTVARRLQDLVQSDVDTPQEMVIWKCGSACSRDGQASKWISDVNMYFNKVRDSESKEDKPNG